MDNKEAIIDYQTDPKYKLSDLNVPDSFLVTEKKRTRKDLVVPGSRVFAIPEFLSEGECSKLIELTETIGYTDVDWEYSKDYRNCKRILTKSEKFAHEIWRRVLPLLVREDVADVKPFGFGTKGTWRPTSINECIRFTKYETGNHFQPHRDGAFVRTDNNRSIYTFMVYLNAEVGGGKTKFYSTEDNATFKEEVAITPETGTALIFNHDVWHEGEQVSNGVKYILRTDIMFERIAADISEGVEDYVNDPDYIKAMELYDKSIEYQKKGDPAESTRYYLLALDMQAKIKSIPPEQTSSWLGLAYDNAVQILNYLSNLQLLKCALVSKSWKRKARDSGLWRIRFEKDFAAIAKFEIDSSIRDKHSDITKNWYIIYKNRYLVEKKFRVIAIDIGAHTTKYGILGGQVLTFPSKVCKYKGHYWASRSGLSHFLVGHEVEKYSNRGFDQMVPFDVSGTFTRDVFEKIVTAIAERGFSKGGMKSLYYYETDSTAHPLLLSVNGRGEEPENLWNLFLENMYYFFPYICIIDSAILGLLAKGFQSGVIVSVGHTHIRVTTIWQLVVQADQKLHNVQADRIDIIAKELATMTSVSVKNQPEERWEILSKQIVVAGVPSLKIINTYKETLADILPDAKIHTWETPQEHETYVLQGAKVLCALPEPRAFFKNKQGKCPSDTEMKMKLPFSDYEQRKFKELSVCRTQ